VKIFVFVYSVTDRESLEGLPRAIVKAKEQVGSDNFIGLLIGNKSDLNDQRVISYEEGLDLKSRYNLKYFYETNNIIEKESRQFIKKIVELKNWELNIQLWFNFFKSFATNH